MGSLDAQSIDGLRENQSLARFTAARLGGRADYLYIAKDPDYHDTLALLRLAWGRGLDVTIIGGGANILVSDAGIRGLTIINRATRIEADAAADGARVTVSSGTNLIRLSRYCQEYGLSGMEWAIAVPGAVGGAVVNNAGAHGSDIASSLASALVYEADGGKCRYRSADLDYAYRHSRLKQRADRRYFVMQAQFNLQRDNRDAIQARMDHNNDYRRRTQPPGASLGSIFKNPPGDHAGRLIEAAGLKGMSVGSAQVSPVHANFIVNRDDQATARDYMELICRVRESVYKAFNLRLELEIQMLGDWS